MALAIAINQEQYRNDSTVYPRLTISGYTETPFIKLATWQYIKAPGASFLIEPNNRSLVECPVTLRDCKFDQGNWTLDASGGGFSISPTTTGFFRNGGDAGGSWKGGYYDTELTGDTVSVQAKATSTNLSTGISLQDTPFASHDYFGGAVAHSIIFGQNGQLSIRELGIKPKSQNVDFRYEVGDAAMIEVDQVNGICRYYLIRSEELVLLRTTRSKLTTNATAEFMLFFPNAELEDILVSDGTEATVTFENIGVARRQEDVKAWQKWGNQRSRVSSGVPIQLADGEFAYTFPSSKRTLRQPSLTPKTFTNEGFQDFEDFFDWHGNEKNFLFVDEARKDVFDEPQTYWARFASPMTDTTKNLCLFDYGVALIEAHRGDYVPQRLDENAPVISLAENDGPLGIAHYVATATDDFGVKFVRFFIDGVATEDVYYSGSNDYVFSFDYSTFDPGDYVIHGIAFDYAGNQTTSNSRTLTVTP